MTPRYFLSYKIPGDGITQWPFANAWIDQDSQGDIYAQNLSFTTTTNAGLELNNLTTAERTALTASDGSTVFDTDTGTPWYLSGGSWVEISGGGSSLTGFTLGSPDFNTALGVGTLTSLTTGTSNDAFGAGAGASLTTGVNNALFGVAAGAALTTEDNNSFFGYDCCGGSTGLQSCTAFGRGVFIQNNVQKSGAFGHNTTVDRDNLFAASDDYYSIKFINCFNVTNNGDIAIGAGCYPSISFIGAAWNVAIGFQALNALSNPTTNNSNLALGNNAGASADNVQGCVFFQGTDSDNGGSYTNSWVFGDGGVISKSNQMVLHNVTELNYDSVDTIITPPLVGTGTPQNSVVYNDDGSWGLGGLPLASIGFASCASQQATSTTIVNDAYTPLETSFVTHSESSDFTYTGGATAGATKGMEYEYTGTNTNKFLVQLTVQAIPLADPGASNIGVVFALGKNVYTTGAIDTATMQLNENSLSYNTRKPVTLFATVDLSNGDLIGGYYYRPSGGNYFNYQYSGLTLSITQLTYN